MTNTAASSVHSQARLPRRCSVVFGGEVCLIFVGLDLPNSSRPSAKVASKRQRVPIGGSYVTAFAGGRWRIATGTQISLDCELNKASSPLGHGAVRNPTENAVGVSPILENPLFWDVKPRNHLIDSANILASGVRRWRSCSNQNCLKFGRWSAPRRQVEMTEVRCSPPSRHSVAANRTRARRRKN